MVRAQYMSVPFLVFIDWLLHKAPFGPRTHFDAAVPKDVFESFMAKSRAQHLRQEARGQLAAGDCTPTAVPFSVLTHSTLFQHGRSISITQAMLPQAQRLVSPVRMSLRLPALDQSQPPVTRRAMAWMMCQLEAPARQQQ